MMSFGYPFDLYIKEFLKSIHVFLVLHYGWPFSISKFLYLDLANLVRIFFVHKNTKLVTSHPLRHHLWRTIAYAQELSEVLFQISSFWFNLSSYTLFNLVVNIKNLLM